MSGGQSPAPTPRDAVPEHTRRKELVADALAHVEDIEDLPVKQQFARLDESQAVLAAVLNRAPVSQLGLPGISRQP